MNKEAASTSPSGGISPRRGKTNETPSLLHASSASFPDLPKRPETDASTLAPPPSPQSEATNAGAMGFLGRMKRNVVQGLRPVPGNVLKTHTPLSTHHGPTHQTNAAISTSPMSPAGHAVPPIIAKESSGSLPTTTPYRSGVFQKLLEAEDVDLKALREASWNGIPSHVRAQMLLNYMPLAQERRESVLMKKRADYYSSLVPLYTSVSNLVVRGPGGGGVGEEDDVDRTSIEGEMLRQ
eukprot:gene36615-44418_t